MEEIRVKQETIESPGTNIDDSTKRKNISDTAVIDLDSSDDDDSSTSGNGVSDGNKRSRVLEDHNDKSKKSGEGVVLPIGFLDPLPPKDVASSRVVNETAAPAQGCKQFWKAGDFEQGSDANWDTYTGAMDHVRVHPRFLHSNATSHKWVLGAFAELLDNSLDEVCNGATYVSIDMLSNKKDGNRMLVIEDNGGGMDPEKMRQCMSLGYSLKSKVANTIGQYGNGFKTSTMRLGADVIVFSRCSAKDGKSSTQSIGLLSYTFLRSTGKEDIIVPMLDYKRDGREWKKIIRSSPGDWDMNMEAVIQWSPFSSEADLLRQFGYLKDQGTRIIIYNLWEDDQGQLELDFDADEDDIQIRGVNRDEKNIQMAINYPNSKHFLTYRHSLRSYSSILYLRIPPVFRIILRGKDVQHHNIVNDMMMTTEVTYRPHPNAEGVSKDSNIVAVVTMGFVKDAKAHIDVQGYNVYHKNRLIKPFWRLWNATGSDGRGVIGVLEANFVEPAHDKQGFERTIVLSRLETRLIQMQKTYWRKYCHKIGYAPRQNKNNLEDRESSPDISPETSSLKKKAVSSMPVSLPNQSSSNKQQKVGSVNGIGEKGSNSRPNLLKSTTPLTRDDGLQTCKDVGHTNGTSHKETLAENSTQKDVFHSGGSCDANTEAEQDCSPNGKIMQIVMQIQSGFSIISEDGTAPLNCRMPDLDNLLEENRQLREKLKRKDEDIKHDLLQDLERQRNRRKELEAQLVEAKEKRENLIKDQENMIDVFAEERERRDIEEEILRKKLKEATATIQNLVERVKQLELEKMKSKKWSAV